MRRLLAVWVLVSGLAACSSENGVPGSPPAAGGTGGGGAGPAGGMGGAAGAPSSGGAGGSIEPPTSCGFDYDAAFVYDARPLQPATARLGSARDSARLGADRRAPGQIAHAEPAPALTYTLPLPQRGVSSPPYTPPDQLVMPGYSDSMPVFERAQAWTTATRCYETPKGVELLTEEQAFDMYQAIAEHTTGIAMDTTPEQRTVLGLRGSYPGRIAWNQNQPNHFNDTLVLLWTEVATGKHVRELPVNTDTGAYDFGVDSSSSLRPNRRYHYINGWHDTYNALHIDELDYRVRDDTNHNGHWDSDRNGWLAPLGQDDHDRTGGGHNIHMGSVDGPLGTATVDNWSAGCQVIPGMANWTEFVTNAWTAENDALDYFLVDVRDIPADVWTACTPDGSHGCPYRIASLPFGDSRSTATEGAPSFDVYNCSAADESGPEIVYALTLDTEGTLVASVNCTSPIDVDVHLLDGDDANACLARDDTSLSYAITPGRYLIVVDTYVSGGQAHSGTFSLTVSLQ